MWLFQWSKREEQENLKWKQVDSSMCWIAQYVCVGDFRNWNVSLLVFTCQWTMNRRWKTGLVDLPYSEQRGFDLIALEQGTILTTD
jgi:hypothetical protein